MIPEKDNPRVRAEGWHSGPPRQDQAARKHIEASPPDQVGPESRTTEPKDSGPCGSEETSRIESRVPVKVEKKSIDVVLDLNDPEQAEKLEVHRAAFGQGLTEVEPLGDGRVVLKIYPGGAKGLMR
jgi:hypothetical protein